VGLLIAGSIAARSVGKTDIALATNALGRIRETRRRTISQFAADEIVVKRGKFQGRYDPDRKPASRLWFDEIESGRWLKHVYTGPIQSGKTLDAFIIPIMYCLFEKGEDTIVGLPDMKMSMAKWQKDILPMIKASRYAKYIPTTGQGARGGQVDEVRFTNGATLIFMSFGGGDKSRAGETAPNLIITEADGANEVSETSEEGTAIDQLIGRTMSFDSEAFIVIECTVSNNLGITWQNYTNGTASRIYKRCPKCKKHVNPEQKDFHGWEGKETIKRAEAKGSFHCPSCKKKLNDKQRAKMLLTSTLVHKGQTIDSSGTIVGPIPETNTLGFRVAAFDNIFRTQKYLSALCWEASRREDQDAAQKTLKQQQFTNPWVLNEDDEPEIDPVAAAGRLLIFKRDDKPDLVFRRGIVPPDYGTVTVGTDIRATQLHSVVGAWQPNSTPHVIDYGIKKVRSLQIGRERAILAALRNYRDEFLEQGFQNKDGEVFPVDQWWIDAGWESKTVYKFIKECWKKPFWHSRVYPYLGRGDGTNYPGRYVHPPQKTNIIREIGDQFHFRGDVADQVFKVYVNADFYKSRVHSRLNGDHTGYIAQLLAEQEREIFEKGKLTKKFVRKSKVNHFLDATYAMFASAWWCGVTATEQVTLIQAASKSLRIKEQKRVDQGIKMPDGRTYTY